MASLHSLPSTPLGKKCIYDLHRLIFKVFSESANAFATQTQQRLDKNKNGSSQETSGVSKVKKHAVNQGALSGNRDIAPFCQTNLSRHMRVPVSALQLLRKKSQHMLSRNDRDIW